MATVSDWKAPELTSTPCKSETRKVNSALLEEAKRIRGNVRSALNALDSFIRKLEQDSAT